MPANIDNLKGWQHELLPETEEPIISKHNEEMDSIAAVLCRVVGVSLHVLRWSHNSVTCPEEAVRKCGKHVLGDNSEVTLWLRGGRVYDYVGDLGSLAEFCDADNPWQSNRSNRRILGYYPFPFLPLPMVDRTEEGVNFRYQDEIKKWTRR